MAIKTKTFDYGANTIKIRVELHTGSNPAPDNDPYAVQWYNTVSASASDNEGTEIPESAKVFERVPDVGILARINGIVDQVKLYLDGGDGLASELESAGFSDED